MTQSASESRWAGGQAAEITVKDAIWNRAVESAGLISTFTRTTTQTPAEGVCALAIAITLRALTDITDDTTETEALENAINIIRATHRLILARRGEQK